MSVRWSYVRNLLYTWLDGKELKIGKKEMIFHGDFLDTKSGRKLEFTILTERGDFKDFLGVIHYFLRKKYKLTKEELKGITAREDFKNILSV